MPSSRVQGVYPRPKPKPAEENKQLLINIIITNIQSQLNILRELANG